MVIFPNYIVKCSSCALVSLLCFFQQVSAALAARIKCIKPVLTVASKLGRSLAELFALLVKLAVGKPIRQRYTR